MYTDRCGSFTNLVRAGAYVNSPLYLGRLQQCCTNNKLIFSALLVLFSGRVQCLRSFNSFQICSSLANQLVTENVGLFTTYWIMSLVPLVSTDKTPISIICMCL